VRAALIATATLAIAACKGDRRAPPAAPPIDAAVAGPATRVLEPVTPATPIARPPMPRLLREELRDAGRAPRVKLRYRFAPVARTLTASARITSHGYDGAWSEPTALAPVREGFAVEPSGGGGPLHVRGLVADVDRAGQSDAAVAGAEGYLARWRALLERRRADVGVDERGRTGDVTLVGDPGDSVEDARDELIQRWVGLAVPLPDGAVGVGARWRVVTTVRAGGAAVTQTADYRLVAVERDRWTIEVQLSRLGRPQAIRVDGLPAGTSAELIAMVRSVKGTVTISPSSPLPIAGALTAEVKSHARFAAPGVPPRDQYSEDTATITLTSTAADAP
jgi:hypothetical protein